MALKLQKICILAILLFCGSCSKGSKKGDYQVGVDPAWYGAGLTGKEKNALAFSTDLLTAIGESQKLRLELTNASWDVLLPNLQKGQYQAILSNMHPYPFLLDTYDFSDLYLATGPVLVISTQSEWSSLAELDGREIAVIAGSQDALLLEKNPGILIRSYGSVPQALADIANGTIDGALIGRLTASSYVQDLFRGILKIATPPLNNDGLRLITLHNKAPSLIKAFNTGLKELQSSGSYEKLEKKWQLL